MAVLAVLSQEEGRCVWDEARHGGSRLAIRVGKGGSASCRELPVAWLPASGTPPREGSIFEKSKILHMSSFRHSQLGLVSIPTKCYHGSTQAFIDSTLTNGCICVPVNLIYKNRRQTIVCWPLIYTLVFPLSPFLSFSFIICLWVWLCFLLPQAEFF